MGCHSYVIVCLLIAIVVGVWTYLESYSSESYWDQIFLKQNQNMIKNAALFFIMGYFMDAGPTLSQSLYSRYAIINKILINGFVVSRIVATAVIYLSFVDFMIRSLCNYVEAILLLKTVYQRFWVLE